MKKHIEELLTYDIFSVNNTIYLSLPVQNLIDPVFSLEKNNLYIALINQRHIYAIKNLPQYVITHIQNDKCYLKENLSLEFEKKHLIKI